MSPILLPLVLPLLPPQTGLQTFVTVEVYIVPVVAFLLGLVLQVKAVSWRGWKLGHIHHV